MGCSASQQINDPCPLQCREAADQITSTVVPGLILLTDAMGQMVSGLAQGGISQWQQINTGVQPAREALNQIWVAEKGEKGWRQSHGDSWGLICIGCSLFENGQQREVALQQGLEKPILFEGSGLGRAHIGQMRMENQGERASVSVQNISPMGM